MSDKISNRDFIDAFIFSKDKAFRKEILSLIEDRDLSWDYDHAFSVNEKVLLKDATLLREYLSITSTYHNKYRRNTEYLTEEIINVYSDFGMMFYFDQVENLDIQLIKILFNKKISFIGRYTF